MSLCTRTHGFTAWINMRLSRRGFEIDNVLKDFNKGLCLKILLEELTGTTLKRLDSLDGMTIPQKQMRFDWFINELKKHGIIKSDFTADTRTLVLLKADEVFRLLWEIVKRDIIYIWEEGETFQLDDNVILSEPFQWSRGHFALGPSSSTMGVSKQLSSPIPRHKSTRKRLPRPDPEDCILDLVYDHVGTLKDCKRLDIETLNDLADSRVLCGLMNSFMPNTFTSEVMLNDRWTINLVLRTAEEIFYVSSSVTSADIMEADEEAMCAYFCSLFMLGYNFRQSRAAALRQSEVHLRVNSVQKELESFPPVAESMSDLKRQKLLNRDLIQMQEEMKWIELNYDIPKCCEWVRHGEAAQQKAHAKVAAKIQQRFDVLTVSRNMTINELVDSLGINLSLLCGSGFYTGYLNESLWVGRKVVLRDIQTDEFYDDFTGGSNQKKSVREMLGARAFEVIEVSPTQLSEKYEMTKGASLTLRNDEDLMPIHCCAAQGRTDAIMLLLDRDNQGKIRRALDRETERNPSSLLFLALSNDFLPCAEWLSQKDFIFKESESDKLIHGILKGETTCSTLTETIQFLAQNGASLDAKYDGGNTLLHMAVDHSNLNDAVDVLIANGADVNALNDDSQTPLFLATSRSQPYIASLLINAGVDIRHKDKHGLTAFEFISDFEEWIELGYFDDHMKARLKAYSLKQSRDLVRAISKKVRGNHRQPAVVTLPALSGGSPPMNDRITSFAGVASSRSMSSWVKRKASQPRLSLQLPALSASPSRGQESLPMLFPAGERDNRNSIIQSVVFKNRTR